MDIKVDGFYKKTSVKDALTVILSTAKTSEEVIPFENSLGRILFEDVVSAVDLPPFDRSAMDGFAIKGKDSFGASQSNPISLKIVGESKIGEMPYVSVGDLEAAPIMTGAPIPKGADAVIMIEYTKELSGKGLSGELEVFLPTAPGNNVSLKGEDVKKGETVLKRGRFIKPHDIGILAAIGKSRVKVFRKPEVAVISTGDELMEVKDWGNNNEGTSAKITDVNSYTLCAMILPIGVPHRIGIIKDDKQKIKDAIKKCLDYDLILISGGSSVGKKDYLPEVVKEMGKVLFHGVSLRPGRPTGFGVIKETPIFILPGFPVSAMVSFEVFVKALLQKMQGMKVCNTYPQTKATLKRKIASEIGRKDFVRVKLEKSDSSLLAEPITSSGSGIISSMVKADGFVMVSEQLEGIEKGFEILVSVYPDFVDSPS